MWSCIKEPNWPKMSWDIVGQCCNNQAKTGIIFVLFCLVVVFHPTVWCLETMAPQEEREDRKRKGLSAWIGGRKSDVGGKAEQKQPRSPYTQHKWSLIRKKKYTTYLYMCISVGFLLFFLQGKTSWWIEKRNVFVHVLWCMGTDSGYNTLLSAQFTHLQW